MQRSELEPGKSYALRRARRLGEPPVEVEFQEYIPRVRKAKVQHRQEPHPGLVEYVPVGVLLCPWSEVSQLLKEEERLQALIDAIEPVPRAVEEAVNVVFAATGDDLWLERSGLGGTDRETLARVAARAGLSGQEINQLTAYPAFFDRRKQLRLPSARMIWLAQRFARAEPELVHLYVTAEEEKYRAEGYQMGQRYMHELLIEQAPGFALARQWGGSAGGARGTGARDRPVARARPERNSPAREGRDGGRGAPAATRPGRTLISLGVSAYGLGRNTPGWSPASRDRRRPRLLPVASPRARSAAAQRSKPAPGELVDRASGCRLTA